MSSFTVQQTTGIHYLPVEWTLEYGGRLVGAQLAFELIGPEDAPLCVVLGGISASRDVPSWWGEVVGEGLAIDTTRHRVLGIDFLGGAGASTGPRNWGGDGTFPLVSSRDQANAITSLLDALGVARVHRFVGSSYGGMVGLALAADHGARLDGLVTIGAAHESHPMALAWRSVQRQIIALGRGHDERRAVALARALAMTTYRSHAEFGDRFAGAPSHVNGRVHFAVEGYLGARGQDFADRFGADEYLALSQAIDLHHVDPARIDTPTLLIGFDSDQLVPVEQIEALAAQLDARHVTLPSRYGHDGFLKEVAALTPILRDAIEQEVL